jgi:hypothetical protein
MKVRLYNDDVSIMKDIQMSRVQYSARMAAALRFLGDFLCPQFKHCDAIPNYPLRSRKYESNKSSA